MLTDVLGFSLSSNYHRWYNVCCVSHKKRILGLTSCYVSHVLFFLTVTLEQFRLKPLSTKLPTLKLNLCNFILLT